MSHMPTPEEQAASLKRTALAMAVEYHGKTAQSPKANGAAKPSTVTATADEFLAWLREVTDRAGIDPDTQQPRQDNT